MVMKIELLRIPLFGQFSVACGMIMVDRAKGGAALRDMIHRGREEAAKSRQIVIFPEGTRRPPGAPPAYQSGIALLYKGLDLPVVPLALNSGLFWPRRSFLKYPGTIIIEFLPPIEPGLESRRLPWPTRNGDRVRLGPAARRGGVHLAVAAPSADRRGNAWPGSKRPSPFLAQRLRIGTRPASSAAATFSRIGSRNPRLRRWRTVLTT